MGTNPEDLRCCLVEAEGEKGVRFSCFRMVGTRRHTVKWGLGQECCGHDEELAIVGAGGGAEVGVHCHRDVLVCGPASSPEKASGENIFVLIFQATYHICKCSSFDFDNMWHAFHAVSKKWFK